MVKSSAQIVALICWRVQRVVVHKIACALLATASLIIMVLDALVSRIRKARPEKEELSMDKSEATNEQKISRAFDNLKDDLISLQEYQGAAAARQMARTLDKMEEYGIDPKAFLIEFFDHWLTETQDFDKQLAPTEDRLVEWVIGESDA